MTSPSSPSPTPTPLLDILHGVEWAADQSLRTEYADRLRAFLSSPAVQKVWEEMNQKDK